MRFFAARVASALLAFLIGVGASHLWHIAVGRHAPGGPSSGHAAERGRGKFIRRAGGIPGQYIVVLNDNVPKESVELIAVELTRYHSGKVQFVYTAALKGFSVTNTSEEAAAAISRDPRVSYVESDVISKLD